LVLRACCLSATPLDRPRIERQHQAKDYDNCRKNKGKISFDNRLAGFSGWGAAYRIPVAGANFRALFAQFKRAEADLIII
jgi:hypothetical protein